MKVHLLAVMLVSFPLSGFTADPVAGKAAAASCAGCHGQDGISVNSEWPNLAGQKEVYIANQLKAYQSGERKNALMSPMAANLSETAIADIAAYYSSLK